MSNSRDVLGVGPTATKKEINAAYRKASLRTHPDVGGSKEEFTKVNEAYNSLINDNNSSSNSRANPYARQQSQQDGTYQNHTNTFGTRTRNTTFHTPNPYRHKTASSIRGTMGTSGTYHFDERTSMTGPALRSKRLRSEVLKQSQKRHTRLNFWVCVVPLVVAYGLYEVKKDYTRKKMMAKYKR
tara:strand:+ start:100 stop:651 length:552 start_codon:yes stop_codon:yes gene_type:complete